MFREGFYLEIIKVKNWAATAVITVKEKTVEVKKKKITTNKWLTLEDWSSLYETLEKALIHNGDKNRGTEKKKFTRHLEIAYTFEASENPSDRTSLPTIRVGVSSLRKKSRHKTAGVRKDEADIEHTSEDTCPYVDLKISKKVETSDKPECKAEKSSGGKKGGTSRGTESKVEEYIPDVPKTRSTENVTDVKYIPSRKSALERLLQSDDSNEYVPAAVTEEAVTSGALDALYVPNSIPKSLDYYETYEPSSSTATEIKGGEYIPNSKGIKKKTEEYQPDFTSKTMRFDDSYVPSSSEKIKEFKKSKKKSSSGSGSVGNCGSSGTSNTRKNRTRESDSNRKESSSKKKNSPLIQSTTIKREM